MAESNSSSGCVIAIALIPLLMIGGCLGPIIFIGVAYQQQSAACGGPSGPGVTVDIDGLPSGSVAGYSGEQLRNAALIMNAGEALGLGIRDQTIGVMTAMGESSLRVIDYGDNAGPDSRGLFQQRANGAWGSYEDRMDPTTSATNFFRAMMRVQGRDELAPTIVAHRTQRNADPNHYTKFWDAAVQVVRALAGVEVPDVQPGTGQSSCTGVPTETGAVNPEGWALPARGPITSMPGARNAPTVGASTSHKGVDIGSPCDSPIWAVQDGVVTDAGPARGFGHWVRIDHGEGLTSVYGHMYANGLLVKVGDRVEGGQQIARVGSDGASTGCHLHLEIRRGAQVLNPVHFLSQVGVELG
ncbi:M23 family metallopeptidase [Marinitenerispora sediminis]|uniref:M23 family peptidase n=1 Tax=Marinitenerispora sediminis TaxID=1931232 RepID=A0A368T4R1_9ACTN|nr:M23 family metallopeptidase [Marinitenerispora sediminis]RCV50306.1 M23 family peptidase [Marinitenerispora sediminis]RCV53759.1 M23 family peptidase [Marinitenerispora sediminis]RCV58048.1 M23 family peptidase [Marinitenerispora sediminis]